MVVPAAKHEARLGAVRLLTPVDSAQWDYVRKTLRRSLRGSVRARQSTHRGEVIGALECSVAASVASSDVLALEADGLVVGWGSFWANFVLWAYVPPDLRGKGIWRRVRSEALRRGLLV